MNKNIKTITLAVVVVIILIVIISIIRVLPFLKYGIGKKMIIIIEEDEIIDYVAINQLRIVDGGKHSRPWFHMIGERERQKLTEYMESNNLKIKPGKYEIFQTSKFSDIKRVLKFQKIGS